MSEHNWPIDDIERKNSEIIRMRQEGLQAMLEAQNAYREKIDALKARGPLTALQLSQALMELNDLQLTYPVLIEGSGEIYGLVVVDECIRLLTLDEM